MTIRTLLYRRKPANRSILAVALALIVWQGAGAWAQDVTITNLTQLVEVAFSADYSLYLPSTPCQWEAFSIGSGDPWWVDCSQVVCPEFPSGSTNLSAGPLTQGVQLIAVSLTKNVLTGETTMQLDRSTNVIAVIAPTNGYQVCTCSQDEWVLRQWQQVTNCPSCWGVSAGEIPPPTVTLRAVLADLSQYPIYESNMAAQAEVGAVQAAAWAASRPTACGTAGLMVSGDLGSTPCAITNDAAPFSVLSISQNTNQFTTITWQSCTDHIYAVYSTGILTTQTTWNFVVSMFGQFGTTSWTDQTTPGVSNKFYKVERLTFDGDAVGDGIANWWRQEYFGDVITTDDDSCASCDPTGDGISNLQAYQYGLNPNATNTPSVLVNNGNPWTTNQTVSVNTLGLPYPFLVIGLDPLMSNVIVLANTGSLLSYTLPTNNQSYVVYCQYADANTNALGPVLYQDVSLDTIPPYVDITGPTNTVTGEAFVNLQAAVYDPSPTNASVPGISRPVNIWINGVPYWNSQGTQIDIPRFPVLPNTNNVITITAQDQAGNTSEASISVYVNPSIDTVAPVLYGFDLPSGIVTFPAVSQVWVSGQMSNLNAIVTATVNGGAPITMNVRSNQFGYLLPVNTGTNTIVVMGSNAGGNVSSNVFTVVSGNRYSLAVTSPAPFGTYANGQAQYVSGYVSALRDAGLPTQTNVVSVTVNGIATSLGGTDGNGNRSFTTTSAVPVPADGSPLVLQVTVQWADGTSDPPMALLEGYYITSEQTQSDYNSEGQSDGTSCPGPYGSYSDSTYWFSTSGATNSVSINQNQASGVYCSGGSWVLNFYSTNGTWVAQPDLGLEFGTYETKTTGYDSDPYYGSSSADDMTTSGGQVTFQGPWAYGQNTPVLLTFEGLGYDQMGATADLSQVQYQGQYPVVWDNGSGYASYLVEESGGQSYTITQGSFNWPSGGNTTYSSFNEPGPQPDGDPYTYAGSSTTIAKRLWFDGFENEVANITIAPSNFVYAVGTTNTFTASGAPASLSYSWSAQGGDVLSTSGSQNQTAQIVFTTPGFASIMASAGSLVGTASGTVLGLTKNQDLWWFNGESPGGGYNITATMTAQGLSSGTFTWSVTSGSSKVQLIEGSTMGSTVSAYNNSSVTLTSTAPSTAMNDVTIQLTFTAPSGASGSCSTNTVVYAPASAPVVAGPTDYAAGAGFVTYYTMEVHDQFNNIVPYNLPVNEQFGTWTADYAGETWPTPAPNGITTGGGAGTARFVDQYSYANAAANPPTVNPGASGYNTAVEHAQQTYRAGSATVGNGVTINTHTLQFYRGQGRQQ